MTQNPPGPHSQWPHDQNDQGQGQDQRPTQYFPAQSNQSNQDYQRYQGQYDEQQNPQLQQFAQNSGYQQSNAQQSYGQQSYGHVPGGLPQGGQSPYQGQNYGVPPQQNQKPKNQNTVIIVLLAVLGVLLVVLLGFGAYLLVAGKGESEQASSSAEPTQSQNSAQSESQQQTTTKKPQQTTTKKPQQKKRPEHPKLPAGAEAANDSAMNGDPAGNFNNVYTGSQVTSQKFAQAVREAYAKHYLKTKKFDAELEVYSEVTGKNYDMSCKDNGAFVTCTGGNNAVVYIA